MHRHGPNGGPELDRAYVRAARDAIGAPLALGRRAVHGEDGPQPARHPGHGDARLIIPEVQLGTEVVNPLEPVDLVPRHLRDVVPSLAFRAPLAGFPVDDEL